jgi:uncharacterized damage-inducible protein DinB
VWSVIPKGKSALKLVDHVQQMAEYNHLMNQNIYAACEALSHEVLTQNRGAFFGSILGTLNHLVVGDTLWLKRFYAADLKINSLEPVKNLPRPEALDSILFTNLPELKSRRELLDQALLAFGKEVSEPALHNTITYKNTKGAESTKVFFSVVMHLFNHQTHHRGQITTLLSQLEIDVGVTDLVAIIPNTQKPI